MKNLFCILGVSLFSLVGVADQMKVVTTLSVYASIASEVAGDRAEVQSISQGNEDAHFVKPKPSFALMLRSADLFVTTGLDLEMWAPVLIDKSGNRKIREGQPGYVSATEGVTLLDVPSSASRSGGDVHAFGNPHVFTSPLNAKIVARNIAKGLQRIDPAGASIYQENLARFERQISDDLYGSELVEMLGAEALDKLVLEGKLIEFLGTQSYQGTLLETRLKGWMGRMLPYRGRPIVAYHKNWIYLTNLFGLAVIDYVEPNPGIPPSARHVMKLVDEIAREHVKVLLAASYFGSHQVEAIAGRTGCRAVSVHLGPVDGQPAHYADLVDSWVTGLISAFESGD